MSHRPLSEVHDSDLIQIVDEALQSAAQRSGNWLVCKPGCASCCVGVFAINQLDAVRLRNGLAELTSIEPDRAARIKQRVIESVARISPNFPGNSATGLLRDDPESAEQFDDFANDEVCPVLDPEHGSCDLYGSRPMTCRVFGPPVLSEDGLGACELCYQGATPEEIAVCEMVPDPDDLESKLLEEHERNSGAHGRTIVAFALATSANQVS